MPAAAVIPKASFRPFWEAKLVLGSWRVISYDKCGNGRKGNGARSFLLAVPTLIDNRKLFQNIILYFN